MANKYMHLINGCPGFFDGDMVCYARHGHQLNDMLVDDLKTIRRHQQLTKTFQRSSGLYEGHTFTYLRIKVD